MSVGQHRSQHCEPWKRFEQSASCSNNGVSNAKLMHPANSTSCGAEKEFAGEMSGQT
jgi:hypothetical protein